MSASLPCAVWQVLQEWMGHRDYRTALIYADYEPGDDDESGLVDAAFSRGPHPDDGALSRISWRPSAEGRIGSRGHFVI